MNFNFEKNKNLIVIGAMILISLVIAKKASDAQTAKCDQLKIEINSEEEKAKALDRIIVLHEKLKKLQGVGWDTTNFEIIVQRVSDLSASSNIKISTIMPLEKKDKDNYLAIPFSANGESTYRNLVKFLKSLETEKKLIRLREVSVQPASGAGEKDDILLTMFLSGEAIYLK